VQFWLNKFDPWQVPTSYSQLYAHPSLLATSTILARFYPIWMEPSNLSQILYTIYDNSPISLLSPSKCAPRTPPRDHKRHEARTSSINIFAVSVRRHPNAFRYSKLTPRVVQRRLHFSLNGSIISSYQ
jgi:hypothetical protein